MARSESQNPVREVTVQMPVSGSPASRFDALCSASRLPRNETTALALPPVAAQALSDLLPLLLCGEASAEVVFTEAVEALPETVGPALRSELKQIAKDEFHHGRWLATLRDRLPPPTDGDGALRAAHFLRKLQSRDLGVQLARVAALDAGACQIFKELMQPGTVTSQYAGLANLFRRLLRDEGRHVRVTTRCAAALGVSSERMKVERQEVWRRLAELLTPGAQAFQNLGVDVRRLLDHLTMVDSGAIRIRTGA